MNNEKNIIELLEDFLDFLKEKEDDSKEKKVKVMTSEDESKEDDDITDDDFDKEIVKISKGE